VTVKQQGADLALTTSSGLNATAYGTVKFAIRTKKDVQPLRVQLLSTTGTPIGNEVRLSSVGGDPNATAWRLYSVPLRAR
jgi:hypothetical protein